MKKDNPIEEARRYVANAREVIKKAEYDETLKRYTDPKYVKMAGNTLWNGCLIALDAAFGVSEKMKKDQRPDITDFRNAVAKRDKKLLDDLNEGYRTMHLYMGYDGALGKKTCDDGFDYAKRIIDRCAMLVK